MFLYIYYAIGEGAHESNDDVAVVRACTKKQAIKLLSKYLSEVDKDKIYRLSATLCFRRKAVHWISYY